jgi:hypothetical protein
MWWTVPAPGDESPFDLSDLVWQQTKAILEREGYVVVDPLAAIIADQLGGGHPCHHLSCFQTASHSVPISALTKLVTSLSICSFTQMIWLPSFLSVSLSL